MTKQEIIELMDKRGFDLFYHSEKTFAFKKKQWQFDLMNNKVVPEVKVNVNGEFVISYYTTLGALGLKTGKCSSIDNDKHFELHYRILEEMAQVLYDYERKRNKTKKS